MKLRFAPGEETASYSLEAAAAESDARIAPDHFHAADLAHWKE